MLRIACGPGVHDVEPPAEELERIRGGVGILERVALVAAAQIGKVAFAHGKRPNATAASAVARKEMIHILRDVRVLYLALALPVVMLFIFGYGINLDSAGLRVGLVLEDSGPEARHFADSLLGTRYLRVSTARTRDEMADAMVEGRVRGFVVVPQDFSDKLKRPGSTAPGGSAPVGGHEGGCQRYPFEIDGRLRGNSG